MRLRFRLASAWAIPCAIFFCACDHDTLHILRYPSGKIKEMWPERGPEGKPTVREGEFQSFLQDGRRESSVQYHLGKKEGEARRWDKDGALVFKGEYRDDFLVREIRYDKSGKTEYERAYSVKTDRVMAVGSAGDSLSAQETCAWSEEPGKAPVKHGLCTLKYGDGATLATRYYNQGRLQGPVKAWYPDGTPWIDGAYDNDLPIGKWRAYTRSGNPLWAANYVAGEKDGAWEEWYPDGQRKARSAFRQGRGEGTYLEWYPSGKPRLRGELRKGRREGQETAWYPDGKRLYVAAYAAGKLDGDFWQWHPDGKLRMHCRFTKGLKDGPSRVWYKQGGLQEQAEYKAGRLNGSYRTFAADGSPMAVKEFRNGAVAFDSKAKELLDLLGADELRVPVGMLGFYWGMAPRECRANLDLYQPADVRADDREISARLIAFPDRHPVPARIRLSFNTQGELWGIHLDMDQKSADDFFPLCENLETEIGGELGASGVKKGEGSEYTLTRKREWGKFSVTTGAGSGGIRQDLPVVSAEGTSPGSKGVFRFAIENDLYREYVNPANTSITPPRWRQETFLAGR